MRPLKFGFAAMLLCTLSQVPAFCAEKWIHATSAHFDLYAAQSESDARAALLHLEEVRAYFVNATHSQDPNGQPVRIVAFQSTSDFNKYKPAEYISASAYPVPGTPATIVALGLKPENYEKIFLEYCQLVMDTSAPKIPYWLRAGLAQFYSTLKPAEATMKLGAPPNRAFHSHGTGDIDLTLLFGIDRVNFLASRTKAANDFYSDTNNNAAFGARNAAATTALNAVQSNVTMELEGPDWTLTHMLMFSPDYRAKVGEFIGALSGGQETAAAFNSVYGRSLPQVLVDLRLYMKQPALAVASVKFNAEKPAAAQISPASKEDEDKLLADLSKRGK